MLTFLLYFIVPSYLGRIIGLLIWNLEPTHASLQTWVGKPGFLHLFPVYFENKEQHT